MQVTAHGSEMRVGQIIHGGSAWYEPTCPHISITFAVRFKKKAQTNNSLSIDTKAEREGVIIFIDCCG